MKYKTSIIIKEAPQIKSFIEKYKRIPKTCTIGNTTLSAYSAAYLLSKVVQDKFQSNEVNLANVIIYDGNVKFSDTINEKIMKDDYLKMINNFIKFCITNKRVPRYITTQNSKTKVSFELYFYCLSKIVNFYKENKTLPNYCTFNKTILADTKTNIKPTNNSNSQSIATCQNKVNLNKGCDAMGQNNSWYCGVCALQKVLYKFGINETQKTLAKVCGTTTSGTSHNGLRTGIAWAAKKHNVKLSVKEAYFSDYTLKQIKDIICNPKKDIILHSCYKLQYGHYEKIKSVDVDKKQFKIVNSLGNKCALGCYCGHIEERSYATQKAYCSKTPQKSLIIVTKG